MERLISQVLTQDKGMLLRVELVTEANTSLLILPMYGHKRNKSIIYMTEIS